MPLQQGQGQGVSCAAWGRQSPGRPGRCREQGDGQVLRCPHNPVVSLQHPQICLPGWIEASALIFPYNKASALDFTSLPFIPLGRKSWKRSWVGQKRKGNKGQRLCKCKSNPGEGAGADRAMGRRRSAQLQHEGSLSEDQP